MFDLLSTLAQLTRRWWQKCPSRMAPPYPLLDWSEMPEEDWPQWYRDEQQSKRTAIHHKA